MPGYWKLDDEMILQDVISKVCLQLRVHENIKRTKTRKRGNKRQMLYRQRKRNSADEIIQVKTRSKSKSRTKLLIVLAELIKIFIFLRKRDWILYGERKEVNNKQILRMSFSYEDARLTQGESCKTCKNRKTRPGLDECYRCQLFS